MNFSIGVLFCILTATGCAASSLATAALSLPGRRSTGEW